MNNRKFEMLIVENLKKVLKERAEKRNKIKKLIKPMIREALEMKKREFDKSKSQILEELDKEVKKIDKSFEVELNDAGNFEMCGCEPHHIEIRPMWNDNFEVLAFKDRSDRTKKIGVSFEDVLKFLKEFLKSDVLNYVDSAFGKSVENNKDKEGKKKDSDEKNIRPDKDIKKGTSKDADAEDAVENDEDLPDQPFKEVDIDKLDKQSDQNSKKPNYKAPKSVSDKLTVKL